MTYLTEFRTEWRALTATFVGLGAGFALTYYTQSIMAPALLRDFGWSKSEFALVSSLSLLVVFVLPLVGRLADAIGARRTAAIGVIALPVTFFLFSQMTGDIRQYIALYLAQAVLCVTTTQTVYSRVVVQHFVRARGLALAIAASGPALVGAVGGPLLNSFVETHGWRAGYQALAMFSIVVGGLALLMLPAERGDAQVARPSRNARRDYGALMRSPAFWIIAATLLLCNIAQIIAISQLKLVLLDNGVAAAGIGLMISTFAIGVLIGRFASGLALDRYPAHLVAAVGLGLPAIGLLMLATGLNAAAPLTIAVLLIGLSNGAEGDVVGILVVRRFGLATYSSVLGLLTAVMSISTSVGAALLSLSLKLTGGFSVFLAASAGSVLAGSLLLLLLGRESRGREPAVEAKAMPA